MTGAAANLNSFSTSTITQLQAGDNVSVNWISSPGVNVAALRGNASFTMNWISPG